MKTITFNNDTNQFEISEELREALGKTRPDSEVVSVGCTGKSRGGKVMLLSTLLLSD
jgi:hypothetical protein